jgi:hypothetical protein
MAAHRSWAVVSLLLFAAAAALAVALAISIARQHPGASTSLVLPDTAGGVIVALGRMAVTRSGRPAAGRPLGR